MDPLESFSDDPSFVILGKGSITNNFDSESTLSMNGSTSTLVQQKLDSLLRENIELKNTLQQNNLAMKSQFETLAKWQQDVVNTHQNHKEKFAETRELVLRLKAENALLKRDLSISSGSESKSIKSVDTEFLYKKIERLTAENQTLMKERDELKENCDKYLLKVTDLETNLAKKIDELDILRGNYSSLAHKSDEGPRPVKVENDIKNPFVATIPDLGSLPSWVCVSDGVKNESERSKKMLEELKKIETDYEEEKLKNIIIKKDLDDLHLKFNLSLEENEELKVKLKDAKDEKVDFSKIKEELDNRNLELDNTLAELKLEKEKNLELRNKLEEMSIAQAQAEVYKSDYEEERNAREKLAGERATLAEELRSLRRQMEELQAFGRREASAPLEQARTVHTTPAEQVCNNEDEESFMPVEEEESQSFACFKCERSCRNLIELQNHVEDCLQLN